MASVVDICNLALAHIGDAAAVSAISPSDGSAQADHCARFYPISRDSLLELFDWDFARRRVSLAEVATAPPASWAYAYAFPSSCARVLAIQYDGATDDTASEDYITETLADGSRVIYTNCESAVCRYTKLISDPAKFTPLFVTTLSFVLGSYLAGPVAKDRGLGEALYKRALAELGKASTSSANAQQSKPVHTPPWVAARGMANPFTMPGRIIR
jgi:hypothetical protein